MVSLKPAGSSDDYYAGLYGGTQWGGLVGDYQDQTGQVFGDLGYRVDLSDLALEPYANLAYVNVHGDGFPENGGAAALSGRGTTDATS